MERLLIEEVDGESKSSDVMISPLILVISKCGLCYHRERDKDSRKRRAPDERPAVASGLPALLLRPINRGI